MDDKIKIPEGVLFRYVTGTATLEEIALVTIEMKKDPELRRLVSLMERMHKDGLLLESDDDLPALSMAAVSDNNLCDVICEHYILKDYLDWEKEMEEFSCEAEENSWLKGPGTPLHHMGRLLEKYGMSVTRSYGNTLDDIKEALSQKKRIIAVVDYGYLREGLPNGVFHAMVCISVNDEYVRVYDPAIGEAHNYQEDGFSRSWAESKYYLVVATVNNLKYIPHPIDVDSIELDDELIELTESIAENAHEIWAQERIEQGWQYGETRDDLNKLHPDLVPYAELKESEKNMDRLMSVKTIKLVKKLGFRITRRYTLYCPSCGEFVSDDMKFCPYCGKKLPWEN